MCTNVPRHTAVQLVEEHASAFLSPRVTISSGPPNWIASSTKTGVVVSTRTSVSHLRAGTAAHTSLTHPNDQAHADEDEKRAERGRDARLVEALDEHSVGCAVIRHRLVHSTQVPGPKAPAAERHRGACAASSAASHRAHGGQGGSPQWRVVAPGSGALCSEVPRPCVVATAAADRLTRQCFAATLESDYVRLCQRWLDRRVQAAAISPRQAASTSVRQGRSRALIRV